MKTRTKILTVLLLVGILASQLAFAQGIVPCGRRGEGGGTQACTLPDLVYVIIRVINFFVGISWIVALFFVFWGAYNIGAAAGNEEKMKAGKADFRNGIIGFFVILAAFLLVNFTVYAFGGYSFYGCSDPNSIYKLIPGIC